MDPVDFQCCIAAILMWISVECWQNNCMVIKKKQLKCVSLDNLKICSSFYTSCLCTTPCFMFVVWGWQFCQFQLQNSFWTCKYIFTYRNYLAVFFYVGVNHLKCCKQFSKSLVLSCLIFFCLRRQRLMQDRVSCDVDIVWVYIVLKYYIRLNLLRIWWFMCVEPDKWQMWSSC